MPPDMQRQFAGQARLRGGRRSLWRTVRRLAAAGSGSRQGDGTPRKAWQRAPEAVLSAFFGLGWGAIVPRTVGVGRRESRLPVVLLVHCARWGHCAHWVADGLFKRRAARGRRRHRPLFWLPATLERARQQALNSSTARPEFGTTSTEVGQFEPDTAKFGPISPNSTNVCQIRPGIDQMFANRPLLAQNGPKNM